MLAETPFANPEVCTSRTNFVLVKRPSQNRRSQACERWSQQLDCVSVACLPPNSFVLIPYVQSFSFPHTRRVCHDRGVCTFEKNNLPTAPPPLSGNDPFPQLPALPRPPCRPPRTASLPAASCPARARAATGTGPLSSAWTGAPLEGGRLIPLLLNSSSSLLAVFYYCDSLGLTGC